ncbi:UNVERIFIED_CONTAM: hypothetical protein Sindi_1254200 [Sesamum indicum]
MVECKGDPNSVIFDCGKEFVIRSLVEHCRIVCTQFSIRGSNMNSRQTIVFDHGRAFDHRLREEPTLLVAKKDTKKALFTAGLLFETVGFLVSSLKRQYDCTSLFTVDRCFHPASCTLPLSLPHSLYPSYGFYQTSSFKALASPLIATATDGGFP